jgi:hypothetical protein
MVANSYEDDVSISRISLGSATCKSQAAYLVDNLKDAAPLECSIPNLAEGDCQELITFETTLGPETLARIGAEESALADKNRRVEEAEKAAEKEAAREKQAKFDAECARQTAAFNRWNNCMIACRQYPAMAINNSNPRVECIRSCPSIVADPRQMGCGTR